MAEEIIAHTAYKPGCVATARHPDGEICSRSASRKLNAANSVGARVARIGCEKICVYHNIAEAKYQVHFPPNRIFFQCFS
jgi:hypothetical protein